MRHALTLYGVAAPGVIRTFSAGPAESSLDPRKRLEFTMTDEQRRTDVLTGGAAVALADLVDAGGPNWDSDVLLPPLWHWVYLVGSPRRRDLGPEGHSVAGSSTSIRSCCSASRR